MPSLTELYAKQKGLCSYCKNAMRLPDEGGSRYGYNSDHMATRDHRIPRSKGGDSSAANVVAACLRCNNLKGSMDEALFRAALKRATDGQPFPFRHLGALAARREIEVALEVDEALESDLYARWLGAAPGKERARCYIELCKIRGIDVAPVLHQIANAA